MRDHFAMLAGYNRWANARLYTATATLDDAAYFQDRKGFFKSIHGTLNHILVGDRIWLSRFTGEGDAPGRLDAILYDEFAALRAAREAEDARIVRVIDGFDEAALAGTITYRNMAGAEFTQKLAPPLTHFFNHQTHHRGQVHDMLGQTGMTPPELDLIYYLREVEN